MTGPGIHTLEVPAGAAVQRVDRYVADSAISLSILLLFIAALRPSLVEGGGAGAASAAAAPARPKPATPYREGVEDPWDEDVDR